MTACKLVAMLCSYSDDSESARLHTRAQREGCVVTSGGKSGLHEFLCTHLQSHSDASPRK